MGSISFREQERGGYGDCIGTLPQQFRITWTRTCKLKWKLGLGSTREREGETLNPDPLNPEVVRNEALKVTPSQAVLS